MRGILTLSILLIYSTLFGQIEFRLYSYDPCSSQVRKVEFFGLKTENNVLSVTDTAGRILLKDTGIYKLSYAMATIDTMQLGKQYHINSTENFSDTLRLLKIESCMELTSHANFIGYCCCNDKCEGIQIDYYENGSKRIEGLFRSGVPSGELKIYSPDGRLSIVKKYSKQGRLLKIITF